MPSTLSAPSASVTFTGTLKGGTTTAPVESKATHTAAASWVVGSAANQSNKIYHAALAINTSGATTLDLTALTDHLGASISFTKVHAILVTNKSTAAGENITVESSGANPFFAADVEDALTASSTANASFSRIYGGDGKAVDGTHKNIDIAAAAGAAVPVLITIIGR